MPFTLSHPAAAVPFARWGLVLSALVVGSLSPDLNYFLCLSTRCQFGHTLLGIFLLDIPAGFAVLWLFHTVLKRPLLSLLPVTHQQCLMPLATHFHFVPWQRFWLIVLSLLLGALTHIVWDSFTHYSGWMVQQLPILRTAVIEIGQNGQKVIRVHHILQQGSTLLGVALLFYWYYQWFKQAPRVPITSLTLLPIKTKWLIILIGGLSAGFLGYIYAFLTIFPFSSLRSFEIFVGKTVISGMTIAFVELVILSLFWHIFWFKKRALNVSGK